MQTCEVCGNSYDKMLEITHVGTTRVFDSFQCAISSMAPRCAHCEVPIIGHGIEDKDQMYCCAHCARQAGQDQAQDRIS